MAMLYHRVLSHVCILNLYQGYTRVQYGGYSLTSGAWDYMTHMR